MPKINIKANKIKINSNLKFLDKIKLNLKTWNSIANNNKNNKIVKKIIEKKKKNTNSRTKAKKQGLKIIRKNIKIKLISLK